MRISDWSSDVCSSDLGPVPQWWLAPGGRGHRRGRRGVQRRPEPEELRVPAVPPGESRSEERRVGKECVSKGCSRSSQFNYKKQLHYCTNTTQPIIIPTTHNT